MSLLSLLLAAAVTAAPADGAAGQAVPPSVPAMRPAKITAESAVYNRKEGTAFFDRHVHVDDERCQLHADQAYVLFAGTNDLKRIVAIGNVAITNENRRAYGGKATYNRAADLVVLHAGTNGYCEVYDEKNGEKSNAVRGSKIRYWIGSEQVEVIDAVITAPTDGIKKDDLKKGKIK